MSSIPALAGLLKPRHIKAETSFDVILKAWLDHQVDQLPDNLKNMLTRWRKADALMRDGKLVKKGEKEITQPYTFQKLADYLVEEFKVSYRTAYDDIANAKKFFLSTYTRDDKDFARGVMIEWGEKFMFECIAEGDRATALGFYKAINELKGLLKDEQEGPDYANINLPVYNIVADPSELGFTKVDNPDEAVKRILAKRKKGKLDQLIAESESIDYTEQGNGGD